MAAIVNDRDVMLAASTAAGTRTTPATDRVLILSANSRVFHVPLSGVGSPASISFTAILLNMAGTVSFTATNCTVVPSGNSATVAFSSMTADTATVMASITVEGITYTSTETLTKVFDGSAGQNGLQTTVVYAYQRKATAPTLMPGDVTFTFASGKITTPSTDALLNGWTKTIPAGANPLYIAVASATSITATDTIANAEWATPVVLAENGIDGTPGANATAYWLSRSAAAIQKNIAGVYSPTALVVSSFSATGVAAPIAYAGRFKIATSTDGIAFTDAYTSGSNQSTYSYTPPAGIKAIRTRLYLTDGVTLLDEEITPIVVDGENAISAVLSNSSATVPTDSAGGSGIYTSCASTMTIYKGATDDSANWTVAATPASGVTGSLSGKTYTVTNMTVDIGYVDLVASRSGYASITKRFTISKALAGQDAALLTLDSTSQSMTYDGLGVASPTTQTITFTASLKNVSGTVVFACTKYNTAGTSLGAVTLAGSGLTRTLTNTQFTTAAAYAVITATLGALTDTITVVRLEDGAIGADGEDALVGYLTNESFTTPTASDGSSADFTGASGFFKVFYGLTDVTASCTFSVVGSPVVTTTAPTVSTGAYSVTAVGTWPIGTKTTSVTYRATYAGETIDKVFSISKSIAGIAGVNTATVFIYQRETAATPVPTLPSATTTYTFATKTLTGLDNGWTTTVPSSGGTYLFVSTATAASNTTTDLIVNTEWAPAQVMAQAGSAGDSSRRAYSKTTLTALTSSPATLTTSGSSSFPPNATWGSGTVWTGATSTLAEGETLWQSDGVYSPVTGNTIWNAPYLSSLKVGNLSAITVNTGALTVSGTISDAVGNWSVNSSGQAIMKAVTIIDAAGNVVLASGATGIDYTKVIGTKPPSNATVGATWGVDVGGTGKPADNATVGATFGTNVYGQITAATASTYIANLAVGTAQIALLAVGDAQISSLNVGKVVAGSLSALSATIGTLRTATTGARTEITDNLIRIYDSSNVMRVRLGVW
jgi:hypothetical protein